MTADPRVQSARACLAQLQPVDRMPPSALMRAVAELRDHLRLVLAVVDGPALVLTASWEAVLGQALGDAIAYREPSGACPDCDQHPAGLCPDHADDLDRCDAYGLLAKALGVEL